MFSIAYVCMYGEWDVIKIERANTYHHQLLLSLGIECLYLFDEKCIIFALNGNASDHGRNV